ncbi:MULTISPECIES: 16S rRNA (guanine(966)-N(2))-methyltransferase RsmD [Bacillaceae]|uniref:16S rRNA (guanine(966)-N(2))-methyltransferase RsmD n=1 Tax=Bacillaceae TaxID=186817 RepID=UPI001E376B64|nr:MULTISPECIES: 16S rRNA (guanine(966)-N(2))-methyltransferase RsmD [Bacillaceae]MCE4048426.1 16S rRNA (guanine(966)-N(2))-methyltransferase RsmD [Bacillus sp. Au-Bac7]MCM3029099.1 16S rRNA (guanine(966)-N(2))-methyltransferase RsmD [Niallia sp. MER 6]UPO89509.1 16S rRNA (guanine(966)-N(2))-methyltransferase RsmD [Niallia sp. Man26]
MRVVSGTNKGISLKAVPGNSTRPTTDKVKEAIFNMIGPYFEGGIGLDLFAGSGGLGIEALSRGLEKVIFVDKDGKAIHTVKTNIAACKLEAKAEVYRNEADRALKALIKRDVVFDYIFLDPPYKKQQLEKLVLIINEEGLLADDGVIVCEHGSEVALPEKIGSFQQIKYEKYGIIAVSIYSKQTDMEENA